MPSRFKRLLGERRYKRMFVIVAEGTVTELQYFRLLDGEAIVHVNCLENKTSLSPDKALIRVKEHVQKHGLRAGDEAWVVVDRDAWLEEHLVRLHAWAQTQVNYGFALSNPKFEYWLLLHFEDAKNVKTSRVCDTRLTKNLPGYNKHINHRQFTIEKIYQAVARAKKRDTPPCNDWPRVPGSTVYRLVEKILAHVSPASPALTEKKIGSKLKTGTTKHLSRRR
jgi:hypothetical protein